MSTQTPWSSFVLRNYEKTNFIKHKTFASFSEIEEIEDESLAFEVVSDWIQINCDEFDHPRKRALTGRTQKINYWDTPWGQLLQNPEVKVERSKWGKLFRRRFRVPYSLFNQILVPKCREANIFAIISEARVRIPLEFKLLMCLRILTRGNVADDIAEMSYGFESSVTAIFHIFCVNFAKALFDMYVFVPTGDRLERNMSVYSRLGIPGAFCSIDATQTMVG